MKDLWEQKKTEEKIAEYRTKWLKAKKNGDLVLCTVYEKCVRALKKGQGEK